MADFILPPRYQVTRPVGRGSFGTLVAARDLQTGKTVAIKKVEGGSGALGTDRQESKKLLREMRLLQHFKHENMMTLHDILTPHVAAVAAAAAAAQACASGSDGAAAGASGGAAAAAENPAWRQTFYLVQDLMDTDLHRVIQSAGKGQQQLSENHIRCFAYQLLRGVYACHSAQVLHRDLKPSNLLVNKDCTLRIGDFGLARGVGSVPSDANRLTEYVVTRWYRAPELLCGNETYGPAIDLWSVGCILAEMLGKTALFPGRDVLTQLRLVVTTVGVPSAEALRTFITNEKAIEFILGIARQSPAPQPLAARYPGAPPEAVDLLGRLLDFDPARRISAADALRHPFLRPLHDLNAEPEAPPFDFSFEEASDPELRDLLEAELRRFHPEVAVGGLSGGLGVPPGAAGGSAGGSAGGGGCAFSSGASTVSVRSDTADTAASPPTPDVQQAEKKARAAGVAAAARGGCGSGGSSASASTAADRGGIGKRRR